MKKYYMAYDKRYRQIHKEGLMWEVSEHTPVIWDVISAYNITKNQDILDIGVGEGRDSIFLLKNGYNVFGIDCSEEAINVCKNIASINGFDENRFFTKDIVVDLPDKKYDFIYSIAVIHMLCREHDRKKFFQYIKNSLKDNGIALVMSMGDGETEYISNYHEAYKDAVRTHFSDKKVVVASTSCKIVNKNTFISEAQKEDFKVKQYFVSDKNPSFDKMMCMILSLN